MKSFRASRRIIACIVGVSCGSSVGYALYNSRVQDNKPVTFLGFIPRHVNLVQAAEAFTPSVTKWDFNWDRRDPSYIVPPPKSRRSSTQASTSDTDTQAKDDNNVSEVKQVPSATRHIILIRHGQYQMVSRLAEEKKLTELGIEQARYTGERLRALGYPYTIIYNSTMCRATETADIISQCLTKGLEPVAGQKDLIPRKSCDLIREGAPIAPEPFVGHWRPNAQQSFYEDGARIEAGFRKYFHRADIDQEKDSYEIFVCHANVIRYYVCRALQFPPEAWLRLSLPNGSITWLTIRPNGRVVLRSLGDSGHIPPDKVSTT